MENPYEINNFQKNKETLPDNDPNDMTLTSAETFASEVIAKYPQISKDNKLNYYFSGSLATMLLLNCGRFEILDEYSIPSIIPKSEKILSKTAKEKLQGFIRKIGDLDFVRLEEWNKSDNFMSKGGGGPQLADLSDTAKQVLEISSDQAGVMCDPLSNATVSHHVARVKIKNNKEVYITEPKMMLAYKIVHIGQSFDTTDKTDKLIKDFECMLDGFAEIYSRKELLAQTHDLIIAYNPTLPNDTIVPYHNSKFDGKIKNFYDEILGLDDDIAYLDQLEYGKERSIGVLKVLHKYKTPEVKQAIIDFFNQNKKYIDKWSINSSSPKNREIIADFLLTNSVNFDDLKLYMEGEVTRENIIETLKTHQWALYKYGQNIEPSILEMYPSNSKVMDIMININEENAFQELKDIEELLSQGMDDWYLYTMLEAKFMNDKEKRSSILSSIKKAINKLDNQEFENFIRLLSIIIRDSSQFDSKTKIFTEIKDEERPRMANALFEKFNIG